MTTAEALRACSMFAAAGERTIAALAAAASPRQGERGEILFVDGDPGRSMFVVVSGLVQLAIFGVDGRRLTLGHAGPAACFGELVALDGGRRSTTATVARTCDLLEIPSAALRVALADDPAMLEGVLAQLVHLVRTGAGQSADLALADLERRVARAALDAPAELTQQELADLAGGSRQMVNAVLAALCRRGLLQLEGGRPRRLDRAGLRRLADGLGGA
jgi:CRP/FNR family transcriptional regulator, cyclic AMP receptor protein